MRCPMHKIFPALVICCFLILLDKPAVVHASTEIEQLILFTQAGDSRIHSVFQDRYLPGIRQMAEKMGLQLNILDIDKGGPLGNHHHPNDCLSEFQGKIYLSGTDNHLETHSKFRPNCPIRTPGKRRPYPRGHPHMGLWPHTDLGPIENCCCW